MNGKRLIAAFASCLLTFSICSAAGEATAKPSPHAIYVDGKQVSVAAYEINDNNYFKLRDIAAVVNGTGKQFEVSWSEADQAITLTSNHTYTTVGGELGAIVRGNQTANTSTAKVSKDGAVVSYTGYNINNNNYYKLRDVAKSFDIGLNWDGTNQRVDIITTEGYAEEGTTTKPVEPTKPEQPDKPSSGLAGDLNGDGTITADEVISFKPKEIPAAGEYTDEYLDILANCGEEIVTRTVKYETVNRGIHRDQVIGGFEMSVWISPNGNESVDSPFGMYKYVETIYIDKSGKGSFEIKMPKSIYEKTMFGEPYFCVYSLDMGMNGPDVTLDGNTYSAGGYTLDSYYLSDSPSTLPIVFNKYFG